jgi:hypothetical protein
MKLMRIYIWGVCEQKRVSTTALVHTLDGLCFCKNLRRHLSWPGSLVIVMVANCLARNE